MPRRGTVIKREVLPDPVYENRLVTQLINKIMQDGKKGVAESIAYGAFEQIKTQGKDPLEVLEAAMKNIMPVLEVKARRVGGATYQVPVEVRPERRVSLGLRWLIQYARARGERGMTDKLAAELMDAANSQGAAVRRREEMHRMAESNRAFAHYRW
ncbi:MAG TPA: 30S ribosomal protein S7 [Limnochordia bacterium]|nr:30S ribosomal protein S7 [Limnochordia bacterium]